MKAGVDENAVLYANAVATMKDKGIVTMGKAESEMKNLATNLYKGLCEWSAF